MTFDNSIDDAQLFTFESNFGGIGMGMESFGFPSSNYQPPHKPQSSLYQHQQGPNQAGLYSHKKQSQISTPYQPSSGLGSFLQSSQQLPLSYDSNESRSNFDGNEISSDDVVSRPILEVKEQIGIVGQEVVGLRNHISELLEQRDEILRQLQGVYSQNML